MLTNKIISYMYAYVPNAYVHLLAICPYILLSVWCKTYRSYVPVFQLSIKSVSVLNKCSNRSFSVKYLYIFAIQLHAYKMG